MAKAILDIHRTRIGKEVVSVPLHDLRQIHRLDRENAVAVTEQRIRALEAHRELRAFWRKHLSDAYSGEVHVESADQERVLGAVSRLGVSVR